MQKVLNIGDSVIDSDNFGRQDFIENTVVEELDLFDREIQRLASEHPARQKKSNKERQ